MKVAVIGGGSSYAPELINGFLERSKTLPLTELWLMDISFERLEIVGGFAQRIVQAKGSPFTVRLTTDQRQAIRDASYVITQLRVGGMEARRKDEYLGRRHDLIGQETTGLGGMAKALRTIPIILKIAADVRSLAPNALLVNFTNPAGLITEALSRNAPDVQAVGVCNIPIITKMKILEKLEERQNEQVKPESADLKTLGLNHLSWHYGFTVDGKDIWPQVFDSYLAELKAEADPAWDLPTLESLRMIPNSYLQYYYYPDQKLAAQKKWPPSRAEQVMEIEKDLLNQYAQPDRAEPPAELMERGGAYYSTVATQLLNAHFNNSGETHVLNVPHRGAVADWPDDWVLELPCKVTRAGLQPLPAPPLPLACSGLIAHVKAYEILTVQAAVHGDRNAAYQALLTHPLGPVANRVDTVLADLLETHRPYLPQFWSDTTVPEA
jgi:6-phospho-beta-glucosidase